MQFKLPKFSIKPLSRTLLITSGIGFCCGIAVALLMVSIIALSTLIFSFLTFAVVLISYMRMEDNKVIGECPECHVEGHLIMKHKKGCSKAGKK
jgi:hypothetical protein